jgi:RNA-directed DNA polymerase
MPTELDLSHFFNEAELHSCYNHYKESKTDVFDGAIRIPSGTDGVIHQTFEKDLDKHFRNISKRVLEGCYFFHPTREFEVPKPGGGERTLSVASIRDAIVQRQLYKALLPSCDSIFREVKCNYTVSFGYRTGLSAAMAAREIFNSYKQGYGWAFDADITKFFDKLSHDRLMSLVDDWLGANTIGRKLIWRFIRTDRTPSTSYNQKKRNYFMTRKPKRERREAGVPQGGVLSGMLANLYLHEFDRWVVEDLAKRFDLRYYRYADDFVILTRSQDDALALYEPVKEKLGEIHLELSEAKTNKSVDITSGKLEFVGFRFLENHIGIRRKTEDKFKEKISHIIRDQLNHTRKTKPDAHASYDFQELIRLRLNRTLRGPDIEICETCQLPKSELRNWLAFFSSTITDVEQLKRLDKWIRTEITKALHEKHKGKSTHQRLEQKHWRLGKARTLCAEYYWQRRFREKYQNELCKCTTIEATQ